MTNRLIKASFLFGSFCLLNFLSCKKVDIEEKPTNYAMVHGTGTNTDIVDFDFINKENGLAITNPTIGNGIILKTTNGGMIWSHQNSPLFGQLRKVQFFESGTAFIASDTFLLKSTDSGSNWKVLKTGKFSEVHFASEHRGYAIYNGHEIVKTTDGGQSWNVIYNSTIGNNNYVFQYISAPDENTIYVKGWSGTALDGYFKSTDGGSSWTQLAPFTSEFMTKIYFYTPLNGFVFLTNKILKTNNGGVSWKDISFSSDNATLSDIHMATENIGFGLAGASLTITNSAGDNWREPFITERTKEGDFSILPKKVKGFKDRSFYVGCADGKFAVVNAYHLGE